MKYFLIACGLLLTLGMVCMPALAEEEKPHICFSVVDADADGSVTFEEFKEHFGDNPEKFASVDSNGDHQLSHDEYHKALGHGTI